MNESEKNTRLYSIEHLEEILDRIPYEIWIKDVEGRHIYGNKLFCDKAGITKESLIGKKDCDFRKEEFAKMCEYTDKLNLEEKNDIYAEEDGVLDGDRVCYKVNKFLIDDEKSNEVYLGGFAEEVTFQKGVQLDLEESITKYIEEDNETNDNKEFLLKTIKNIQSIVNCREIDIFLYNENESKLQLYLSTNETNDDIQVFLDDKIVRQIANFKVSKKIKNLLSEKIINSRKEYKGLISKVKPLKLSDKTIGIISFYYEENEEHLYKDYTYLSEILRKISMIIKQEENKKTLIQIKNEKEELKSLVELECIKNEFFANVSHEFRTPVNMIISVVQLLESFLDKKSKNIDKESFLKYLNILRQNSYRLLRLVNNTIDTAKINSDICDLKLTNNNIISIIEEIVMSTVSYTNEKNRNIIFDTDIEELVLACDVDQIERVILNLISNAIKFSHENTDIEINIKTDFDNEKVFISIRNYGNEISDEDKEKIFGKFVQIENIFIRNNEGSGIGLFLSKKLIEMHEGKIYISENKNATEFTFYLPIKTVKEENIDSISDKYENNTIEKFNIEFSDIYT